MHNPSQHIVHPTRAHRSASNTLRGGIHRLLTDSSTLLRTTDSKLPLLLSSFLLTLPHVFLHPPHRTTPPLPPHRVILLVSLAFLAAPICTSISALSLPPSLSPPVHPGRLTHTTLARVPPQFLSPTHPALCIPQPISPLQFPPRISQPHHCTSCSPTGLLHPHTVVVVLVATLPLTASITCTFNHTAPTLLQCHSSSATGTVGDQVWSTSTVRSSLPSLSAAPVGWRCCLPGVVWCGVGTVKALSPPFTNTQESRTGETLWVEEEPPQHLHTLTPPSSLSPAGTWTCSASPRGSAA